MMAHFLFSTQREFLQFYTGPSGTKYTFERGIPKKITNKQDVEYFSGMPNRFRKVNFLTRPVPQKREEDLLREYLESIEGLSKESVDRGVLEYSNQTNLEYAVKRGTFKDSKLPKDQAQLIYDSIMGSKAEDAPTESEEDRYERLKDLNKKEQSVMLKKLGVVKIPKREPGRIKLIMELEDKKMSNKKEETLAAQAKEEKKEESPAEESSSEEQSEEEEGDQPEDKESPAEDEKDKPSEEAEEAPEEKTEE